jgi:hypothetical protein
VNQEIEQFLQIFCSHLQDDWDQLLAFAEFSYNNSIHATTQATLFMLDTGRSPRMGFEPLKVPLREEATDEFRTRMERAVEEAKAAIAKAQDEYALYYNRRRTPALEFKKGGTRLVPTEAAARDETPTSSLPHSQAHACT